MFLHSHCALEVPLSVFQIFHRWNGSVVFETELSAELESAGQRIRLGAAIKIAFGKGAVLSGAVLSGAVLSGAVLSGADLSGADLRDADLSGADLRGADLRDADLSGADLRGAVLRGADLNDADLREIKNDFWGRMLYVRAEVPGLLAALREGKINGQVYQGDCACFVGTIANIHHCYYEEIPGLAPDISSPTERWFLGIATGDTPATSQIAAITEGWIVEFLALTGHPVASEVS